ncbi:MAG: bifunctional DNA-formamidopyrimidine glycosylase/DNA-(apurinic or apyrimidinic site) lyase [Dehalococcoidia bacterium]
MPELPDVEAIRRYLVAAGLPGRRIREVTLLWPRAVREPSPEEFRRQVRGRRIQELRRRAKFLLLPLDAGGTLILHLRMTGSLLLEPFSQPRHPLARTIFALDDGRELRFVDPRKLGMLWLVEDAASVLAGLGPEPLEPRFTPQVLAQRLNRRQVPIKALLCDQSVVAGLGNIYADEVLFAAGIHPLERAADLAPDAVQRLHRAIQEVLPRAAERLARLLPIGGPPTESEEGLKLLAVPRREGEACPRCGTPVRRLVLRGRSAYLCPRCQPG